MGSYVILYPRLADCTPVCTYVSAHRPAPGTHDTRCPLLRGDSYLPLAPATPATTPRPIQITIFLSSESWRPRVEGNRLRLARKMSRQCDARLLFSRFLGYHRRFRRVANSPRHLRNHDTLSLSFSVSLSLEYRTVTTILLCRGSFVFGAAS